MAVVQVHREKYILSQSTGGYLEFLESEPLELWLIKQMPWCVQTLVAEAEPSHLGLFLGPDSGTSPSAHPWLLGLPPGLSVVWLRPVHRLYTVPEGPRELR